MVGSTPPLQSGFLCSGLPHHVIEDTCAKAALQTHHTAEKWTGKGQVTSPRFECKPATISWRPQKASQAYPCHYVNSLGIEYILGAPYFLAASGEDDGGTDRGGDDCYTLHVSSTTGSVEHLKGNRGWKQRCSTVGLHTVMTRF